jgi:hypothetical protein
MATKKTDRAVATTTGPMRTPVEMVATGTTAINSVTASPLLPNAPDVKTALGLFATENTNLDNNNKKKADIHVQLVQVEADEITITRRWGLRRAGLLQAVNVQCDGSAEQVQSFNLPVVTRKAAPLATVPANLHQAATKKPTTVVTAWTRTPGNDGYLVQWATDPTNQATYSKPTMCKKARFSLPGQTLGATLHFRVLALDASLPGGQSDYTAWVMCTVGL